MLFSIGNGAKIRLLETGRKSPEYIRFKVGIWPGYRALYELERVSHSTKDKSGFYRTRIELQKIAQFLLLPLNMAASCIIV